MKRLGLIAFLCLALTAGFAGSLAKDWLIEPVSAQAPPPLKIALLDLEKTCRASKKFSEMNKQWEEAIKRDRAERVRLMEELNDKKAKLRALEKSPTNTEDIDSLRPDIAAMEQYIEWYKKSQNVYLEALIDEFQKQVLNVVRGVAEEYCQTGGYHLCLQDFEVPLGGEDELFKGATFSQRWLSKPVLFAPGVKGKTNPYVIDITDDIINLVKRG
jgi:Skp family chaperone for outer membrane proteins